MLTQCVRLGPELEYCNSNFSRRDLGLDWDSIFSDSTTSLGETVISSCSKLLAPVLVLDTDVAAVSVER